MNKLFGKWGSTECWKRSSVVIAYTGQKGNYRETLRENNDMLELNWKLEDRLKEYIDSL